MSALVPPEIGRVRFDAGKTIWLWGMAVPGLAVGIPAATPATLIVSLALAFLTLCIGHSVGLHRGIIHRTYEAHPVVRGVLAYLFVLSGLGGPLSWARLHAVRDLWQNRPDCPRYFAFGEGFHNNHHAFPGSARMGMRAAELDLGWLVIRSLERLGLVRAVAAWHRAPVGAAYSSS